MKLKIITLAFILSCSGSLFAIVESAFNPNDTLLPSPFPLYVKDTVVMNHPGPGFVQKSLPTNNDYNLTPGCYITCYSHQAAGSVYAVNKTTFVIGQVRVAGLYNQRMCEPSPYQGKDISAATEFKTLCAQKFPTCGNYCWAGGDTGGWFGIQPISTGVKTNLLQSTPSR